MTLAEASDHTRRLARGVPLPREAPWPRQSPLAPDSAAIALPVPAQSIFEIQEKPLAATQGLASHSHQAEQTVRSGRETDSVAKLISIDAGDSRGNLPEPIGAR